MSENLSIERGMLMLYHCFDVGEEILLDRIEEIFGEKPVSSRLAYKRLTPEYVQFRRAPLLITMGHVELDIGGASHSALCQVKLYAFGVVTIIFKIPLHCSLQHLAAISASSVGVPKFQQAAKTQLDRLLSQIKDQIVSSTDGFGEEAQPEWEDYAIFSVERFRESVEAHELLMTHGKEIAKILRSESEPLSDSELADATRQTLSYYQDELAVIDWNAAFLVDPRQSYDVPDVLEYAVVMLLELRTYDALLDSALDRAYDDLEKRPPILSLRPFATTINYLLEVKLDVSQVIERVTNSLKLIGDLYLARIFSAAAARFSLNTWESSVQEKLEIVQSLYTMIHDRTQDRLMIVLEMMIVVLFVVDIVLLFLGL